MDLFSRYLAVLYNGPMLQADVIVGLMGEDAEVRLSVCLELFRQHSLRAQGAPTVLLSGAESDEPHKLGAAKAAGQLLGHGIDPALILVEPIARNTHEQAVECVKLAALNSWYRILLVASAYHMPRAFLTFVAELKRTGALDKVDIVPVPACAPWFDLVPDTDYSRLGALEREREKMALYGDHVASYEDALTYLCDWERRRRKTEKSEDTDG